LCGKETIFIKYVALDLALGKIDCCQTMYTQYLKAVPYNCTVWKWYAELKHHVGKNGQTRAIYDLAISQPALDILEMLWKRYIDFEIGECKNDHAQKLYEQLLVWTGREGLDIVCTV